MKKLLFLLFAFVTVTMQAQTANGSETQLEGLQITTPQTVSTSANVTSIGSDGTVGKVAGENITITYTPINYSPASSTLKSQLNAIDTRLGQIGNTTDRITNRIYFTGDNVTVTAGTFFSSNGSGKGTATSGLPTPLVNGDNQKQYFAKDLISIAQPSTTTAPPGNYSGQLTVTSSPTPNGTQQRYTIEIYKTNNGGTPIASGITGASTGSLGVTVVAILDSGLINLVAGSITNISLNGNLASTLSLATGERLRYHVSAQKVGTGGENVTMSVLYGSDYNSYYDVTVTQKASTVINDSGVVGSSVADALNTLNTGKINLTEKGALNGVATLDGSGKVPLSQINDANVVHLTGSPEIITSQKTFNGNISATSGIGRGTYFNTTLIATANSDVLVGLDVNPTFVNGAFTSVQNIGVRAFSFVSPTADILLGKSNGAVLFGSNTETYLTNPSNSSRIFFRLGSSEKGSFMPTTGNFILQDGGTFSDEGFRLDVKRGGTRMFRDLQSDVVAVNNSAAYIAGGDVGVVFGQYASSPNGAWMQSTRFNNIAFPLAINPNGGSVSIGNLSGTGDAPILADASGNLKRSTNSFPSSGSFTPSSPSVIFDLCYWSLVGKLVSITYNFSYAAPGGSGIVIGLPYPAGVSDANIIANSIRGSGSMGISATNKVGISLASNTSNSGLILQTGVLAVGTHTGSGTITFLIP